MRRLRLASWRMVMVRAAAARLDQVGGLARLAEGRTSAVITGDRGVQVFAGVTADQFAGDASALESFEAALAEGKYMPEAFENPSDFFHPRHVAVIVVQVPTELIGAGLVHGWATVSLHGHAPDVQVYLEAEFYSYAVNGEGLPENLANGTGQRGPVTGGHAVQFGSGSARQYL